MGDIVEFKCYTTFQCVSVGQSKKEIPTTGLKKPTRIFFKFPINRINENFLYFTASYAYLNDINKEHIKHAKDFDIIIDKIDLYDIMIKINLKRKEFNPPKIKKLTEPKDKLISYKYQYKVCFILTTMIDKIKYTGNPVHI